MNDPAAAQILHAWFSPAYPVGAYSYSHGLEHAIEAGTVTGRDTLQSWTSDLMEFGSARTDAILLANAWRADDPAPLAELAEALSPSTERHLETMAQGGAFSRTTSAAWEIDMPAMPYPVAVGRAARLLGLPLDATATCFIQAFAANIVSAGIRLIPLGQTDGQRVTAALIPLAARVADGALEAPIEAVGGSAFGADLASMLHETQRTRLYRS